MTMKHSKFSMESNINTGVLKNIFRSLHYRNFRLFFIGQSISLIGTWIQRIALPWLVYDLTKSAFLLGLVGFAGQIPMFFIAPFAGVITDRLNRYHLLVATQVFAMLQAFILAFLILFGVINIWLILVLNILLGCINAFDTPVRQSFFVEIIDNKDDLPNAIALNSSMVNAARLLGPSIAGVLIAFTGEGMCFLINALSYIPVVTSLLMMRIPPKTHEKNSSHVLIELKEGFFYTFGHKVLKHIILLLALVSLMGMPYTVLMPVFAKEILHGGSYTFGFLMGASGLGALAGALYLASKKNVLGLGRLIAYSAALFGTSLLIFSFSRIFELSLLLMAFIGLGMMMQMASSNTLLQTLSDDDKRGRVMSFYTMAYMGTAPFGSLLAGGLADLIGVTFTIAVGGICCMIGAALFWQKLPQLRQILHPIYVDMGIIPEVSSGLQTASDPHLPPEE
ncbi:MAG TPA: MFS transporter [Bacteroidales bacterium]|nr:MFS transporter [Bacteroidales bacterium]HPL33183.1 MFS transporter [Bacteroidales bacterium]